MFERINLKNELIKEKGLPVRTIMDEVNELLKEAKENDQQILQRLKKGGSSNESIRLNEADQANIFNLADIKKVCVNYRLRFLDSKYYKGEYPYEALLKIREFEARNNCEVQEFKVMAPSKMFRLIDPDKDPLLFANIGNGNYYLIHQWGNDLAWYRRFLAWPFRNLKNIVTTLLALSMVVTFFIPSALFIRESDKMAMVYLGKMIFFLLFTLGTFALTLRISLRGNKNLNDLDWDSRYLH